MVNQNDIFTALQNGEDPQAIANAFADALNAAMNGLLFENGAAFHTVTVDEAGHIKADLNDAFAAQVRSFGTSGEYYLVGGVVNTLLDIYDGADVTLTVNGAPLESGHAVYDTALTRFAE